MHASSFRVCTSSICSLAGLALAVLTTGCATTGHPSHSHQALYQWHDDGGPGEVTVRISLPDQIAEYERGGRPIGWSYVATGKSGYGTGAGNYHVMEKIVDKYSSRFGRFEDHAGNVVDDDATSSDPVPKGLVYVPAPMPYWMRITSYGVGMHGGVIPQPGTPASHGCVRLPREFAPVLYNAVHVGTPVIISHEPSHRGRSQDQSAPLELAHSTRVLPPGPLDEYSIRRRPVSESFDPQNDPTF